MLMGIQKLVTRSYSCRWVMLLALASDLHRRLQPPMKLALHGNIHAIPSYRGSDPSEGSLRPPPGLVTPVCQTRLGKHLGAADTNVACRPNIMNNPRSPRLTLLSLVDRSPFRPLHPEYKSEVRVERGQCTPSHHFVERS
jgi:hypothetical protein